MSAIGVDFGNDSCLVAVARQGRRGIEVLQNEMGKRNTPTMVSFVGRQRLAGAEAEPNYQSNFKNTVVNFKQLVGRKFNEEAVVAEAKHNLYKMVADEDGNAAVEVKYDGKPTTFSPEEVSAGMLAKLKQIAEENMSGHRAQDFVLAVPPFWTDGQRRALLDACRLAGLNVLSLINETTAVALNYGIIRPPPAEGHQDVLFMDVGHSATYASLARFEQGKVTMVATESAFDLGGRDFDELLVNHFAAYCKEKYKLNVTENPKAMLKLRKECARLKKFLSANKEAQFRVDYLMEDTDVSGSITRQEFEDMAKPLLGSLEGLVDRVFKRAKISDIHSCEIVGGASRIPMVQDALREILGRELSKTCDGDESVAKGAALQCAMLSPNFRVKQYQVIEQNPYSVEFGWYFNEQPDLGNDPAAVKLDGSAEVFESSCGLPTERSITFKPRTTPLTLLARYKDASDFPEGTDLRIARFTVAAPPELPSQEIPEVYKDLGLKLSKPKIKVYLSMDTHGLINLTSAQILLELPPAPPAVEEPKAEEAAADPPAENGDAKPEEEPAASEDAEKMDTSKEEQAASAPEAAPAQPKTPAEPPKKIKRRIPLKVDVFYFASRTQQQFQALEEREANIQAANAAVEALHAARNSLEAYVLDMRSKVRGEWSKFVVKEQASEFIDKLNDMEDWLFEDGEDAQKSEVLSHLETLKKTGNVIQRRWYEASNRGDAFMLYDKALRPVEDWLAKQQVERQENVTDEEVAQVQSLVEAAKAYIAESQAKLEAAPDHEDPPILIADITDHQNKTLKEAQPIISRPKPEPKPEAPAKEEATPAEEAPAEEAATDGKDAAGGDAMQDDPPAEADPAAMDVVDQE